MPDNKKETSASNAASSGSGIAKFAADSVGGLFEGIGQFIRERPIFDLMVGWGMSLVTAKVVASGMRDFLQNDPNARRLREEERRRMMAELELGAERFLDRVKEEFENTFGKAYKHLQKAKLMNDREFREFIAQFPVYRDEFRVRREQAERKRRWFVRGGVTLMIFIILCGMFPHEQRVGVFMVGLILVGGTVGVALAIQNNNRRPIIPVGVPQTETEDVGE